MMAVTLLLLSAMLPAPTALLHTLPSMRVVRLGGCTPRAYLRACASQEGEEEEGENDWDSAWVRFQLESVDGAEEGSTELLGATELQDAMADLISAEAAVRVARIDQQKASDEREKLLAELGDSAEAKKRLPYSFEELDEVYRLAQDNPSVLYLLLARLALGVTIVALLLRGRVEGAEGVAGCLLMPIACATGQI